MITSSSHALYNNNDDKGKIISLTETNASKVERHQMAFKLLPNALGRLFDLDKFEQLFPLTDHWAEEKEY